MQVSGHVFVDPVLGVNPCLGPGAFPAFLSFYLILCLIWFLVCFLRTIGGYSRADPYSLREEMRFPTRWNGFLCGIRGEIVARPGAANI